MKKYVPLATHLFPVPSNLISIQDDKQHLTYLYTCQMMQKMERQKLRGKLLMSGSFQCNQNVSTVTEMMSS